MVEPPTEWSHRLLLLRHGEVASHGGDVPVTEAGLAHAEEVGRRLALDEGGSILLLSGETLRTRQTAELVAQGARAAGANITGPVVSFALRNPDLYLAGHRVEMVSTAGAFAEQVPGLTEDEALAVPFFGAFLNAPDRIECWLNHPNPPGDDVTIVARRLEVFAGSLADFGPSGPHLIVAITHSPVIRACALSNLGADPGEPRFLGGLEAWIRTNRTVHWGWLSELSSKIPAT